MRSLVWLAGAGAAAAQQLLDSASFGHKDGRVSPNLHAVPAWHLSGSAPPKVHSDRLILTPPHPGGRQGAAWTEARLPATEWQVELAFRASGPDHGAGSLQVWYTRENQAQIAASSIYTVGKFDGLAIVVDQQGGRGGGIRGFLNDGTTDYKGHPHLEALAFGHCEYPYRNLGRPSLLKIRQDARGFEVNIDGRSCFRSDDVLLPSNNYLGVTAASADTADSFEIFKFATTTWPASGAAPPPPPPPPPASPPPAAGGGGSQIPDGKLDEILRMLQSTSQAVERIKTDMQNQELEARRRTDGLARADQVTAMQQKVTKLESALDGLRKDFGEKDYTAHFNDLRAGLNARHDAMLDLLPEKMHSLISSRSPRLGFFIFLVLLFQVGLAAAYIVYKRRRASAPKKYL